MPSPAIAEAIRAAATADRTDLATRADAAAVRVDVAAVKGDVAAVKSDIGALRWIFGFLAALNLAIAAKRFGLV